MEEFLFIVRVIFIVGLKFVVITFVIMTPELWYYNHKWINYDYTYEFLWKGLLVIIKLLIEN